MTVTENDPEGLAPMLNALLDRNGVGWRDQMDLLEPETSVRAILAAASAAVYRRWPSDPTDAEIAAYAATVPVEGAPVPTAVIEGIILAAFGQDDMISGFAAAQLVPGSVHLVHAIQGDGRLPDTDREAFIAEIVAALV